MISLIDPRPLEPADPPIDYVRWTIFRYAFINGKRVSQSFEETGSSPRLLQAIAQLLQEGCEEFEVYIAGQDACWEWNARKPYYYDLKYPNDYPAATNWRIIQDDRMLDEGLDSDELMGWIEYSLADSKSFIVEVAPHDPTT
jgi:hypothetical protein